MATGQEFTNLADLASARVGGRAIATNDDFFAPKANLVKPGPAVFIPEKYTSRGKWMDGWESRRKRVPGHDWCILQLATSGKIFGVDIDTNHFLGNHPPHASIDATSIPDMENMELDPARLNNVTWKEILSKSPLQPGSQNFYEVSDH